MVGKRSFHFRWTGLFSGINLLLVLGRVCKHPPQLPKISVDFPISTTGATGNPPWKIMQQTFCTRQASCPPPCVALRRTRTGPVEGARKIEGTITKNPLVFWTIAWVSLGDEFGLQFWLFVFEGEGGWRWFNDEIVHTLKISLKKIMAKKWDVRFREGVGTLLQNEWTEAPYPLEGGDVKNCKVEFSMWRVGIPTSFPGLWNHPPIS